MTVSCVVSVLQRWAKSQVVICDNCDCDQFVISWYFMTAQITIYEIAQHNHVKSHHTSQNCSNHTGQSFARCELCCLA